jgi:hypothetical protein
MNGQVRQCQTPKVPVPQTASVQRQTRMFRAPWLTWPFNPGAARVFQPFSAAAHPLETEILIGARGATRNICAAIYISTRYGFLRLPLV